MSITRRTVLAAGAASAAIPAFAQDNTLRAAAAYSAERRGISMLVMRAGEVVFEDYPNGGGADRFHELASGTKSFCGVIAALAVKDGLLALDEACADTLHEWRGDARRAITIRQLLSLTSGLAPGRIGMPPGYEEAVATPLRDTPGAVFQYGPAPFQIFGEIMKRKLAASRQNSDPTEYLRARVLAPEYVAIGQWRRGRDGNPLLPQGAALTARNWAKFGDFVMRRGERLLDVDALSANFVPTPANPGYGLSWWLLRPGLRGPTRSMPIDAPADLARRFDVRMAAGAGDQRLYLIPPLEMVIVRQADGILAAMLGRRGGPAYSDAAFLRLALGA